MFHLAVAKLYFSVLVTGQYYVRLVRNQLRSIVPMFVYYPCSYTCQELLLRVTGSLKKMLGVQHVICYWISGRASPSVLGDTNQRFEAYPVYLTFYGLSSYKI